MIMNVLHDWQTSIRESLPFRGERLSVISRLVSLSVPAATSESGLPREMKFLGPIYDVFDDVTHLGILKRPDSYERERPTA